MALIQDRRAGRAQALTLIGLAMLPALAIVSLVPNLPQLFEHFKYVPNHELWVPMVLTIPSLCIALFAPLMGLIADKWGRRPLLLVALVSFSFLGLLPMMLDNLYAIIASRFIVGMAEAAILTVCNALMGDYFAGKERQKWLGMQSTVGPVFASALILAGGALGTWSWRGPFALYSLGLVVLLFAALTLWEPTAGREPVQAQVIPTVERVGFPWVAAALVGTVTIGVAILYYVQAVQLGRIFADLGATNPMRNGVVITVASVGVVIGGWSYQRLFRFSVRGMLAIILAAYGVGYLGLSRSSSYLMGLPFAAIAQYGNGLAIPTLINWALTKYGYEHRGRGMGLWGSCFFVAQFLSPPTVLAVQYFSGTFLKAVGVLGFVCLIIAAILMARGRPSVTSSTPSTAG
jgi:predicted MFS family arabinose efflux permease